MPHNHPPRCCCKISITPAGEVTITTPCPSCIEHGDLARLSRPHAIAYNPADEDHDEHADRYHAGETMAEWAEDHQQKPVTPAECASCHALPGQPHTDYCQAPNSVRVRAGLVAEPGPEVFTPGPGHIVKAADHPGDWTATLVSTPPTETATPETSARRGDIFSDLEHTVITGGRRTTHLRALCRPHLCGQEPTPSR